MSLYAICLCYLLVIPICHHNLIRGRELLHIQGLQFEKHILDGFSEPQLTDLAGTASRGWGTGCVILLYSNPVRIGLRVKVVSQVQFQFMVDFNPFHSI